MSSGQGNAFSEGGFYYTIRSEVLFPMLQTILNVVLILLIIGVVVMAVLYFLGSKLQKRQLEQEHAAQTVSLLVIDKKKVKMTQAVQAGLPKMVLDQTPRYLRWTKVPIVKAKIGPKIVTLVADERVFQTLPVKTEAKVVLSGLYISQIKSVRGGSIPAAPQKKGFFSRFKKDKKKDEKK